MAYLPSPPSPYVPSLVPTDAPAPVAPMRPFPVGLAVGAVAVGAVLWFVFRKR